MYTQCIVWIGFGGAFELLALLRSSLSYSVLMHWHRVSGWVTFQE